MFENKKIFILGMAKSGYEAAKLLAQHQNQILITDQKEQDAELVQELRKLGVDYVVTEDPCSLFDETYDYMIKNPGIRRDHECVQKALTMGVPVINEVEMAYHFLPKDVHIIGITGSNGKTTTATILYEFLKGAALPVHLGGNIGYPLSSLVNQVKAGDILVMEISDHQLHDMYDFTTEISVLTNLTPTHIDFNKTYEYYKEMKKRIFQHHTKKNLAIINRDCPDSLQLTEDIASQKLYFSCAENADIKIANQAIYMGNEKIIALDMIRVKGEHNYQNIMGAIAVAKQFGVSNETIKEVLNNFSGVEHRLEYVRKLHDREFYNDSKSTNNQSTIIALRSFANPTILIMGGLDRGQLFDDLTSSLGNVTHIVCFGQTKRDIAAYCKKIKKDCVIVDTLEECVKAAYNLSEAGTTILFSPACASWDMYPNFEVRGAEFKQFVNQIEE